MTRNRARIRAHAEQAGWKRDGEPNTVDGYDVFRKDDYKLIVHFSWSEAINSVSLTTSAGAPQYLSTSDRNKSDKTVRWMSDPQSVIRT